MNEQNNQSSYYYNPNHSDDVQQQLTQSEPPKKKNKAKKALKIIGVLLGVIIILFVALAIIGIVTDDTDYDESTSQNETVREESEKPALGIFADGSYTNEYADVKFNLPSENWEFKDREYLYDIFRSSGGEMDEEGNVFLNSGNTKHGTTRYYYDMMALDNTTSTSVQFVVTKPDERIFKTTTEDMFLNNSKAISGEVAASDIYDVVIAGETYRAIDLADEDSELGFGQMMAAKKLDDEFVIIIISGYSDVINEKLSDYAAYFVKP